MEGEGLKKLFFSGQRLVRFTCTAAATTTAAAAVQERKEKSPPLKFVPFIFVFYLRSSFLEEPSEHCTAGDDNA